MNHSKRFYGTAILTLVTGLFFSCTSTIPEVYPEDRQQNGTPAEDIIWDVLYPGIEYKHFVDEAEPLSVFACRIDLQHPDRELRGADVQ